MGSVATKDANNILHNGAVIHNENEQSTAISPLRVAAIMQQEAIAADPRSPGYKRTPVHSPQSTPTLSYKERVLHRLTNPVDPRSPSSIRTPLSNVSTTAIIRTPPPFNLSVGGGGDPRSPFTQSGGDPRSPFTRAISNPNDPRSPAPVRTPLSLTQDTIVVDDIIICEGIETKFEDVDIQASGDKLQQQEFEEDGASLSSIADRIMSSSRSDISASPAMIALSASAMNSPQIGNRKKIFKEHTLSPLRKSFSAPINDENVYSSGICKSRTPKSSAGAQERVPLSPILNQRTVNSRYCVDIQPIKFRMDPGLLG